MEVADGPIEQFPPEGTQASIGLPWKLSYIYWNLPCTSGRLHGSGSLCAYAVMDVPEASIEVRLAFMALLGTSMEVVFE